MRSPFRPLLLLSTLAAAAAPLLTARTASAQFDAGTTVSTFGSGDFFIGVQHQAGANLSDFDVARFFNKAHCDCSETVYVYVALTDSGFAKRTTVDNSGNIEFWVGTDCANTSLRETRCLLMKGETMQSFILAGRDTIQTDARTLSTYTGGGGEQNDAGVIIPFTPNPDCTLPLDSFDQTIYVLSNTNGTPTILDQSSVHIDLTPPPAPSSLGMVTVLGGNEAVTISWPRVDSSIVTDLLGYQVLCNRAGDLQVFNDGTFGAGFQECAMPGGDAGVGTGVNDGGVNGQDPRFICSPLLSATTSSFRVKILQNDITYGVAVVSIDISGNASKPDTFYKAAVKTKSFYDVYRNDEPNPGAANGGLCTLGAGTSSRGAVAGLGAALALAAVFFVSRRRRK